MPLSFTVLHLLPNRRGEPVGVGNTYPKRGVVLEADDLRDLVHERDAQALTMVRAEGEPIVGEAKPHPDGCVPAMRAGDERVVDVVERGLHFESPKGCDKFTFAGYFHAVFVTHAEHEK